MATIELEARDGVLEAVDNRPVRALLDAIRRDTGAAGPRLDEIVERNRAEARETVASDGLLAEARAEGRAILEIRADYLAARSDIEGSGRYSARGKREKIGELEREVSAKIADRFDRFRELVGKAERRLVTDQGPARPDPLTEGDERRVLVAVSQWPHLQAAQAVGMLERAVERKDLPLLDAILPLARSAAGDRWQGVEAGTSPEGEVVTWADRARPTLARADALLMTPGAFVADIARDTITGIRAGFRAAAESVFDPGLAEALELTSPSPLDALQDAADGDGDGV